MNPVICKGPSGQPDLFTYYGPNQCSEVMFFDVGQCVS